MLFVVLELVTLALLIKLVDPLHVVRTGTGLFFRT